ncbi:MAG: hypothetical protein IIB22_10505, partial [Chloroflexi bacterium]|nr:hypothetical protein [Chloroflexota bacterium]
MAALLEVVQHWSHSATTQPALRKFDVFPVSGETVTDALARIQLTWKDADLLDGLDKALASLVVNAEAAPGVGSLHMHALHPLTGLTQPPFVKERKNHEVPGFEHDIPGFRTLIALSNASVRQADLSGLLYLISRAWFHNSRLAIVWAERCSDQSRINSSYSDLPFARDLFES